jgi:Fe/S biogenesis protein NfuA
VDEAIDHEVRERLRLLRRRRDVDPEVSRGGEKLRGAIGRRWQDQQDTSHTSIIAGFGRHRHADRYDAPVAADDAVLEITDEARKFIADSRAGESDDEHLALFLEVSGESGGAYTYDMWFEDERDAGPADAVQRFGSLPVVVTATSIPRLLGATLEFGEGGLAIRNPNAPAPSAASSSPAPESDLSSPIELAVIAVLDSEVNPQIASHGGRADLVAVDEEGVAYLRLSGGCQGCGLAQVTLSQGISVAIKEAVPQITDVVDVTSHGDGSNPYFQAEKK